MKKMKRRIAGLVLIMMLITIVISPASFSAWADKTDEESDSVELVELEEIIADETQTDGDDEEFDTSCIIDSRGTVAEEADNVNVNSPYNVGDIIKFGQYEQDGNEENGKEDIEWQVLKVEENRVLVVSKYAIDCQPYNTENKNVTWETCSLRSWLNNDFKNNAFSPEEQGKIPEVTVVNEGNPYYGTSGGNDTQDQIFCLSLNEIESLIGYNWYDDENMYGYGQKMIAEPTAYAIERGAYSSEINEGNYALLKDYGFDDDIKGCIGCRWWLRSPAFDNKNAGDVDCTGLAGKICGSFTTTHIIAVRPALYVDISPLERHDVELEAPVNIPEEEVEDVTDLIDEIIDELPDEITDDNQIKDEESSEEYDDKDTDVDPGEGKEVTDEDSSEKNMDEDAGDDSDEKNEVADETEND